MLLDKGGHAVTNGIRNFSKPVLCSVMGWSRREGQRYFENQEITG